MWRARAFVAAVAVALCADETITPHPRAAGHARRTFCGVAPEITSNNPRRVRDRGRAQSARAEIARLRRGSAAAEAPEDASEVADARGACERRRALVAVGPCRPEHEKPGSTTTMARALPPLLPEDLAGASVELRERVRPGGGRVLVQAGSSAVWNQPVVRLRRWRGAPEA